MTRMRRIDADLFSVLSAMIRPRPRHPHSIEACFAESAHVPIPNTQVKTDLKQLMLLFGRAWFIPDMVTVPET